MGEGETQQFHPLAHSPPLPLMNTSLSLPPDFFFDAVVRSHGWYNLPPFEYNREKGELRTSVELPPLPSGEGRGEGRTKTDGVVSFSFRVRQGRLEATCLPLSSGTRREESPRGEEPRAAGARAQRGGRRAVEAILPSRAPVRPQGAGAEQAEATCLGREELRKTVRRVFSLDLELETFAGTLASEPPLARALARGGGRMLRAPTLFEDAVKVLLTTNCSWAATRGMVVRLIAVAGAQERAFPTAESVARLSVSKIQKKIRCGYRAEALARFARRVASGRLDLSAWEQRDRPAEEIREAILAERGFGPYAAEGLLRILGRHDFLALDSWTRQKYRRLHPGPARSTDRAIARRYARFGPFRGLALWLELTADWHAQRDEVWP